jgi:hypothetical protein
VENLYKGTKKQDPLFAKINKNALADTNPRVTATIHGRQSKNIFYKIPLKTRNTLKPKVLFRNPFSI